MEILEPQGIDLAINLEIDTEHVLRRLAGPAGVLATAAPTTA